MVFDRLTCAPTTKIGDCGDAAPASSNDGIAPGGGALRGATTLNDALTVIGGG